MGDRDGGGRIAGSSVDELLELLGMNGDVGVRDGARSVRISYSRPAPERREEFAGGQKVVARVEWCEDGVQRLHIYGCGRRAVRLSVGRCQAIVRGWERLGRFADRGARAGTRLSKHLMVREVGGVLVVEVAGEVGRPVRLTAWKVGRVLQAERAIRAFARQA